MPGAASVQSAGVALCGRGRSPRFRRACPAAPTPKFSAARPARFGAPLSRGPGAALPRRSCAPTWRARPSRTPGPRRARRPGTAARRCAGRPARSPSAAAAVCAKTSGVRTPRKGLELGLKRPQTLRSSSTACGAKQSAVRRRSAGGQTSRTNALDSKRGAARRAPSTPGRWDPRARRGVLGQDAARMIVVERRACPRVRSTSVAASARNVAPSASGCSKPRAASSGATTGSRHCAVNCSSGTGPCRPRVPANIHCSPAPLQRLQSGKRVAKSPDDCLGLRQPQLIDRQASRSGRRPPADGRGPAENTRGSRDW